MLVCKAWGGISVKQKQNLHTISGGKVAFFSPSSEWDFLLLVTPKDSKNFKS